MRKEEHPSSRCPNSSRSVPLRAARGATLSTKARPGHKMMTIADVKTCYTDSVLPSKPSSDLDTPSSTFPLDLLPSPHAGTLVDS